MLYPNSFNTARTTFQTISNLFTNLMGLGREGLSVCATIGEEISRSVTRKERCRMKIFSKRVLTRTRRIVASAPPQVNGLPGAIRRASQISRRHCQVHVNSPAVRF